MNLRTKRTEYRHELVNTHSWNLTSENESLPGDTIVNISKNGVCIALSGNVPILIGEEFNFGLSLKGKKPLNALGKVHWVRHSPITNLVYIGLRFNETLSDLDSTLNLLNSTEDCPLSNAA